MKKCILRKLPDDRLYFRNMGGAGIIRCSQCKYAQEFVSFLHGANWERTGYQCQKCFKFLDIENEKFPLRSRRCECGGKLARDRTVFCPRCRTNNVTYESCRIT